MIIRLSKDLERIVGDAVRAGLYAHEDAVIRDALLRLKDDRSKDARTRPGARPKPPAPTRTGR